MTTDCMSEGRARQIVKERASGRCELCGAATTGEWAHRVNRSHAGPWCPANGLNLCGYCHRDSELHPEAAYALGIRLRSTADPHVEPVPILTWGNCLLDDQGGYVRLVEGP